MRILFIALLIFSNAAWGQHPDFIWPTDGKIINGFDTAHKGIDIAGKAGQPIVAAGDGKVLYAKSMRGYGNLIILEHRDGLVTAYAHNKVMLVREGQSVSQGQQIAEMGDSDSDVVKLGFQMRHLGKPIDPTPLLVGRDTVVNGAYREPDPETSAENEQAAFEKAAAEIRARNFRQAAQSFAAFLKRYPESVLTADAFYFLGSSQFADGDCKNAIPALRTVTDRFPAANRAPDALLNIAICQYDMNDVNASLQTLENLIKIYPKSGAALTAKDRLSNYSSAKKETRPSTSSEKSDLERERRQLAEERQKLEQAKRQREQQRQHRPLNLQITHTQPAADGSLTIHVQTNTDTASLKINGSEEGGNADGKYIIKRIARAGQTTRFDIIATDIYGNTETKSIAVTRSITDSAPRFASLSPQTIRARQSENAVAIIIGIQNYRRVPKAEFASDDARAFYDYAIRALGVKPENIKMLIDDQADQIDIYKALQQWLPVKVSKQKTDVYFFYSGHGLPSDDGKSLYLLPYSVDKDYLSKTAINQQELISSLQAAQPRSVTIFMDACYSGQVRTGDTLLASARPIQLKAGANNFPADFTVFTASAPDQIALSSPDLRHGIFSYYLMKGMEGDADENKDGKITATELQSYINDRVSQQAMALNRRQQPQFTGDANKILVAR